MIEETLEKIPNILEKYSEKTHQNGKNEVDEDKIKDDLSKILKIKKDNIYTPSDIKKLKEIKKIKETLELIELIEPIELKKENFRQKDELFFGDEEWYLICGKKDSKIGIFLSYDKIKDIPCNFIFKNCNVNLCINKPGDVEKNNVTIIKNHLYFYDCVIDRYETRIESNIFEKSLSFFQCKFTNKILIHNNIFLSHLVFLDCHNGQGKKIKFLSLQENTFERHLFIKNCIIEDIKLWKNKIEDRCYFVDSEFGNKEITKLEFSNIHFKDNAYFNNSKFYSYADFHECEFEKIACFYGVTFDKVPNFSACYFKEQKAVNLTNLNIDKFDFKSIENYIEDNYQDETYKSGQETTEEQYSNNCKLKCVKHLKDSFRVIKDVLISQNNILEAQEWHKLELYTKEKEFHMRLNFEERKIHANIFNNILIWFNCVLLNVYRNTSDHHSNLLKILHFTMSMICVYGFFLYFILEIYVNIEFIFYKKFYNLKIVYLVYIFLIILLLFLLSIVMFLYKNKKSIFIKSILFLAIFLILYCIYENNLKYFGIIYFEEYYFYFSCYILGIYVCYIIFNIENKIINFLLKIILYCIFLFIFIINSSFINPFVGVFSSEKIYESKIEKAIQDLNSSSILNLAKISHKDFNLSWHYQDVSFVELDAAKKLIIENKDNILDLKEQNLTIATEFLGKKYTEISKAIKQDKITSNVIKSTSVLYSIILLLCIFSLQKTARKNSIVPS
ncbi:hypothetical protein HW242_06455 [Campylobacter lari]|uniref:Pentapeptide repeat-containing protein n=1 Tax=Campylobacter lari TaxID=201 RepID=A0A7M1MF49_CAMLA|nr:hypothetical protein [Campylobacter lari]QOQ99340.1 hypothetical protein HW242_06455 [Campylobacter lari]